MINLRIVSFSEKKVIEWFLNKHEVCWSQEWTKWHTEIATKAADRRLIIFFVLAISQSNPPLFWCPLLNGMKPL